MEWSGAEPFGLGGRTDGRTDERTDGLSPILVLCPSAARIAAVAFGATLAEGWNGMEGRKDR